MEMTLKERVRYSLNILKDFCVHVTPEVEEEFAKCTTASQIDGLRKKYIRGQIGKPEED